MYIYPPPTIFHPHHVTYKFSIVTCINFPYIVFMAPRKRDISGQRFGSLVAKEIAGKSGREMIWLCWCDCGRKAWVRLSNLTTGNTGTCGHPGHGECESPS